MNVHSLLFSLSLSLFLARSLARSLHLSFSHILSQTHSLTLALFLVPLRACTAVYVCAVAYACEVRDVVSQRIPMCVNHGQCISVQSQIQTVSEIVDDVARFIESHPVKPIRTFSSYPVDSDRSDIWSFLFLFLSFFPFSFVSFFSLFRFCFYRDRETTEILVVRPSSRWASSGNF